ncbi:hydantoinase/oxoprolinase family protein [Bradyrhizobium liaoningense]
MPYALGIDIGGTFTDIVLFDPATGQQFNWKQLTTPDEPSEGVIRGTATLIQRSGVQPAKINRVVHATTLFTNAMIERKGASTGLITTEGFRDVLEIGRERKFELYDVFIEMPEPLVSRRLRFEVAERISPKGEIITPLDFDGLARASDTLVAEGVRSIAIVFLHAYANSVHEKQAAEFVRKRHPEVFVTASCEVAPEIREFERASTAVANAYVKPLADAYLQRLAVRLRELGIGAPLFLMVSSGGLTHIDEAKRNPIQLLESGPAAGALAAAFFGERSEAENVLAFDMGGTTAKLSVVDGGEPLVAYSFEAARTKRFMEGSGLPIKISTIELIEIGAGGGSIAHLDRMGLMKVGPESASSKPGPACYGLGGDKPTVTDANLLLGYLNPAFFAGGTMKIETELAKAAMDDLVEETKLKTVDLAWGIHNIVNENMASAARVHIAERGKDLRKYALVTTGGGGPLHGYHVARKLGLTRMVCPPSAGVASALGLLIAPARVDRVATVARRLDAVDWAALEARFKELEAEAAEVVAQTGIGLDGLVLSRFADMRYVGQGFELVVDIARETFSGGSPREMVFAAFSAAYREIFALNPPTDAAEIVNIRVVAKASVGDVDLSTAKPASASGTAPTTHRKVYFPESEGFVDTPVYGRGDLPVGQVFHGPAVIEEPESTLIVGPAGRFATEANGNITVHIAA